MSFTELTYHPDSAKSRYLKRKMSKRRAPIAGSTLAGVDDLIFVCTEDEQAESGIIHALKCRQDGLPQVWEKSVPDKGIVRTPVVWEENGLLLLSTSTNDWSLSSHLYCLDAKTGNEIWRYPSKGSRTFVDYVSTPIITTHGIIIVSKSQKSKQAILFNAQGKKICTINLNHETLSRPYNFVIDDEIFYIATRKGIAKYNIPEESYLGTVPIVNQQAYVHSQLAINKDMLFIGTTDGLVSSYAKYSGTPLWSTKVGRAITTEPIVWKDTLFVGSKSEFGTQDNEIEYHILALNASDGYPVWSFKLSKRSHFYAPLATYQNNVLAGSTNGKVYAINCKTGIKQEIYQTNKSIYCQPYCDSANQTIYVVDRNTNIVAIKVECQIIFEQELNQILINKFNKPELEDVYFKMGLNSDHIVSEKTVPDMSRELILYLKRRNRLKELIGLVMQLRPLSEFNKIMRECNER